MARIGGEFVEVILFASSLVAYLIGCLWRRDIPPHPFDRIPPILTPEERANLQGEDQTELRAFGERESGAL